MKKWIWGLCFIVAGCAGNTEPSVQNSKDRLLSITPIVQTLTFEGSCEDQSWLFEQWLGMSQAARQNLANIVQTALSREADTVGTELQTLVAMRNGMASVSVPDCARDSHILLIQAIDVGLSMVQNHVNKQFEQITSQRANFDQLLAELDKQLSVHVDELQRIVDAANETSP